MDVFAGALRSLSAAIAAVCEVTGINREQLCAALCQQAASEKNERESKMWKHGRTDKELGEWIFRDAGRKFGPRDEGEILQLASTIPKLARTGLIRIAKKLKISGGKRRTLQPWEVPLAKLLVAKLREKNKPLSMEKAYDKVAKRFGVHLNTIRRECDPKARQRTKQMALKDSTEYKNSLDTVENSSDY
jgi:hypothetical protein